MQQGAQQKKTHLVHLSYAAARWQSFYSSAFVLPSATEKSAGCQDEAHFTLIISNHGTPQPVQTQRSSFLDLP